VYKKNNGVFILRIENSNIKDNKGNLHHILECMENFKLYWGEGPLLKNSSKYFQQLRSQIYLYYLKRLSLMGFTLHFFKLKVIKVNLTDYYKNLNYTNFIMYRGDLKPVFNFVNPIDDIDFQITHVIRGEDHKSNLKKHSLIFKLFRVVEPQYIHIPLLLNPFSGEKLSKKNRIFSIENFSSRGILEDSLLNALYINTCDKSNDFFTIDAMIKSFSLNDISSHNSAVDLRKIFFLNKKHLQHAQKYEYLFKLKNYLKRSKIFQVKSFKSNDFVYLTLKDKLNQFSVVSRLFFKNKRSYFDCYSCYKLKILNKKIIHLKHVCFKSNVELRNMNFKYIRNSIIGSLEGLPIVILLKFYSTYYKL
jgi:glutamyl/glutaminyl-tRNA synthetase